ncbi:MAG TPA: lysylphosphatidylglycerol synthase domain-containing protein [Rhodocyclaceae bacterium]|jgi:hypothetical protein|nr:lysylphosphatidylglycerol synthase domain-containing protein [Rhodocyclaceae bacterium]
MGGLSVRGFWAEVCERFTRASPGETTNPSGFTRRLFLGLIRLSGSLVVLVWALSGLPQSASQNLWSFDWPLLALISLPVYALLLSAIEGARYCAEAQRQGITARGFLFWTSAFVTSRPWAFLLPMAIAAEAAMYLGGKGDGCDSRPMVRVLVSVRLIGLLVWAFLCGLSLNPSVATPMAMSLHAYLPGGVVSFCIAGGGLLGFFIFERTQGRRMPWASVLLAVCSAVLLSAVAFLSARAMGIGLGFLAVMGFLGLLNFAMVLPISVGGLGVQEALLFQLFATSGVPAEQLLMFSILLHVQRIALALVGAALHLFRRR